MTRPIQEIAREIRKDWQNINPHAKPYLDAMMTLYGLEDRYYLEDAQGIVLRFLCNAQSWRGDKAKRIKDELKAMVK